MWGLGFGVWGLGFGVCGVGLGFWGLGFGVWGSGFFFVEGWELDFECSRLMDYDRVLGLGFRGQSVQGGG